MVHSSKGSGLDGERGTCGAQGAQRRPFLLTLRSGESSRATNNRQERSGGELLNSQVTAEQRGGRGQEGGGRRRRVVMSEELMEVGGDWTEVRDSRTWGS